MNFLLINLSTVIIIIKALTLKSVKTRVKIKKKY